MKRVKEGEYGWGTFYTSMNMEHWIWSHLKKGNGVGGRLIEGMNH
jgi:hypothetical protein